MTIKFRFVQTQTEDMARGAPWAYGSRPSTRLVVVFNRTILL